MKLPRDLSGWTLANLLERYGYGVVRQTGSHLRLTRPIRGEQHLTIPNHPALKIGLLGAILNEVAAHVGLSKQEVMHQLFDR